MELKRCKRCGAFFASSHMVCPQCEEKDKADINKLKSFLAQADVPTSLESLSCETGIAINDLNRFMKSDELYSFSQTLVKSEKGNISIQL